MPLPPSATPPSSAPLPSRTLLPASAPPRSSTPSQGDIWQRMRDLEVKLQELKAYQNESMKHVRIAWDEHTKISSKLKEVEESMGLLSKGLRPQG
ncbi:hypothetical protein PHLGIDRAFT_20602 [Phlebiopsis gigantea 11061_1 CR5-6]|uniref:Uncharacterized protein n=1 Tax=Phlebiopsis gigantea (strain 11061_1 CR5-6) TaxID=745531 RepID=A0A0C3NBI3_PHLG1|nr:hypothetical protein PHLGIDRAFT_20602 [Phlebiopsis gigantea 11061_1 CR5-6]